MMVFNENNCSVEEEQRRPIDSAMTRMQSFIIREKGRVEGFKIASATRSVKKWRFSSEPRIEIETVEPSIRESKNESKHWSSLFVVWKGWCKSPKRWTMKRRFCSYHRIEKENIRRVDLLNIVKCCGLKSTI